MKKFYLLSIIVLSILFSNQAYSQQADSSKLAHIKHIGKDLAVSEEIAKQIVFILDQYKQNAKSAINDQSLTGDALRVKLDQLIGDKNGRLKNLLTEQQLKKLIPTTEISKEGTGSGTP